MKHMMNLSNRSPEELADMVLICPVHKLLCTACEHSTRIPRSWLSDEVQRELAEIIAAVSLCHPEKETKG